MAPKVPDSVKEIRQKIAEIHQALCEVDYLSSGTLLKRMKLCGNPRCRCKVDRAARHGPYYQFGLIEDGKLRHRSLSAERAKLLQVAIDNHRKVKQLLKEWEEQTLRLIELTVP